MENINRYNQQGPFRNEYVSYERDKVSLEHFT